MENTWTYKYLVIYRFESISDNNLDEDKIVYQDDSLDTNAILTKDVNHHCLILDTGLACASFLLCGMFSDEKIKELPIALDAEVKKYKKKGCQKIIVGLTQ